MARWVLDANVVAKWSAAETLSELANVFRSDDHDLVAPDILIWEALNVVVGKAQQRQVSTAVVSEVVPTIYARFELYESEPLLEVALAQALQLNISIFDSLYLTVALLEGCPLVTADQGLLSATRHRYADVVIPLDRFDSI